MENLEWLTQTNEFKTKEITILKIIREKQLTFTI